MQILALDLATKTGFAMGEAGTIPQSCSVVLKRPGEGPEIACFNLVAFLRDRFVFARPELAVLEDFLNPVAQPSADAAILSLMLHGAAQGFLRSHGVRVETVAAATWRKHWLGVTSATPRSKGPKTAKQRADARAAIKALSVKRARLLGYLPADSRDDDRAEACGIFDFAAAFYARKTPAALVMFGCAP